jgi:hypothetical protein
LRNTSDLQTVLYVDEARVLSATDPLTRQIHVGCGCFIETLSVGATSMGFGTTVESFPEGMYGRDKVGKKPSLASRSLQLLEPNLIRSLTTFTPDRRIAGRSTEMYRCPITSLPR